MIVDYNKHVLGVDKLDQLMSYYSFLHKSVKWRRDVFFWIHEVAVVNAYIIYNELVLKQGDKPLRHIAFRRQLIASLSEPISSVILRACPSPRASVNIERLRPVPHFPQESTKRRNRIVCSNRKEVPDI